MHIDVTLWSSIFVIYKKASVMFTLGSKTVLGKSPHILNVVVES